MFDKLEDLLRRSEEIMNELSEPGVADDPDRFRNLMKENSDIAPIVEAYKEYKKCGSDMEDAIMLLEEEKDPDMRAMLKEEHAEAKKKKEELEEIVSETKAEEEKLRERAKNLELTIEPRLLNAFKRIRRNSRNGLGIVSVQRDACCGCFNKIPPQRQLDIRSRKKIIVCEYCGRIMIDRELAGLPSENLEGAKKSIRKRASKKKEE